MPFPNPDPDWDPFDLSDGFFLSENPNNIDYESKYQWVTSGWSCPVCQVMSGRIYPMSFWMATVTPGFHPHCDYKLLKVDDRYPESDRDLFGVEVMVHTDLESILESVRINWIAGLAEEYMRLAFEKGDGISKDEAKQKILSVFRFALTPWGWINKRDYRWNYPGYMVKNPRFSFFTLAGALAGNLSNLMKTTKPRSPRAYLPSEMYSVPRILGINA